MSTAVRRLSVVVPTHDTVGLTLACLESLERHAAEHEVVLVDDASSDGTVDAVRRRFPWAQIVEMGERRGFTRAANAGLAVADGDVILLLNSDAELTGGLGALLAAFRDRPRLGAAGASLRYPDGRAQWSGGAAPTTLWLFALASGLPRALARLPGYRRLRQPSGFHGGAVDWVPGTAMALRRAAIDDVGPFDEELTLYAQDIDLCTRLRAADWEVRVMPDVAVLHHLGATIRQEDASEITGQKLAALWRDLLVWGARHHEPAWVDSARNALRAGGELRYAWLWLTGLFPEGRRKRSREERRRLRQALAVLDAEPGGARAQLPTAAAER